MYLELVGSVSRQWGKDEGMEVDSVEQMVGSQTWNAKVPYRLFTPNKELWPNVCG